MQHFTDRDDYREFVRNVANAEAELSAEVPDNDRPSHLDGYQEYEDEYTIARLVVGVPHSVGDDTTMLYSGEPWVTTRACPVAVLMFSDHRDDVPLDMIDENDVYRASIIALARDLHDALTP